MTRPTPSEMLAEIARALHGGISARALGRDLGVDEGQIRRWLRRPGRLSADHAAFAAALTLLERRAAVMAKAAERLRRWRASA